jgi:hypothetical protein
MGEFTMSVKCFLKYVAIAFGFQIGLLALCWVLPIGNLLVDYVYAPEIWVAESLTGATGEHAMIVTPVLGWIGGLILYSLLAGIVICSFKSRRQFP